MLTSIASTPFLQKRRDCRRQGGIREEKKKRRIETLKFFFLRFSSSEPLFSPMAQRPDALGAYRRRGRPLWWGEFHRPGGRERERERERGRRERGEKDPLSRVRTTTMKWRKGKQGGKHSSFSKNEEELNFSRRISALSLACLLRVSLLCIALHFRQQIEGRRLVPPPLPGALHLSEASVLKGSLFSCEEGRQLDGPRAAKCPIAATMTRLFRARLRTRRAAAEPLRDLLSHPSSSTREGRGTTPTTPTGIRTLRERLPRAAQATMSPPPATPPPPLLVAPQATPPAAAFTLRHTQRRRAPPHSAASSPPAPGSL